jgi:PAS domain S-box-containing protein
MAEAPPGVVGATWTLDRRDVLRVVGIGIAYYVTAQLSLRLSVVEENITPLWPPTGIAVAAMLMLGKRVWPGILAAAFLVNVPINAELWAAAATGLGNTVAPIVAVVLLERVGFQRNLRRLVDAVAIVWTALVAMTVSATVGTATLLLGGVIDGADLPAAWSAWWTGDAMGVLVVAPLLLTAPDLVHAVTRAGFRRRIEIVVFLAGVVALSLYVMSQELELLFLVLLAVGVTSWRFRQAAATPAALIAVCAASYAAARGLGPFDGSVLERMLTLQAFNAAVALTSFVFAAIVAEREERARELAELNHELENRVVERTAELSRTNERLAQQIDERRATEEALRRSERSLGEAQAIARVGSWEWDVTTDAIVWSDQMFAIHGLRRDGSGPTRFEDVLTMIDEDDAQRVRANVKDAFDRGDEVVPSIQYRIHRPDGTTLHVLGTGRIVREAGRPVRMIGTVQDLSERLERQREHRIAEELQLALLPRELPTASGVEVAAHYRPAGSDVLAGGDWYDAIVLPDGRLLASIGDVAGHGIDAASVMGQIRMAVRAALVATTEPAEVMRRVDDVVQRFGPLHLSTLSLVIVDRANGTIEYASAGHPPPLLIERGVGRYLPSSGDPPLAATPDHAFRSVRQLFPAGSMIVLFTDGLVDRRDSDLDAELERVRVAAGEAADGPPMTFGERLVGAVIDETPEDDVAVLSIRSLEVDHPELRIELAARVNELPSARRGVRQWLEGIGVGAPASDDIVLACHEAVTNAIEHAGVEDGTVIVKGRVVRDTVVIDVEDRGIWRDARPSIRGRGLALIEAVTDRFDLSTGADGTRITIARRIGRPS